MASGSIVVDFKDVDVNKVIFHAPKVLQRGNKPIKVVNITYEGKRLCIRTPYMGAPFGATCWADDKGEKSAPAYSLELSFRDADVNPDIAKFQELLYTLDQKARDYVQQHATELLGSTKKLTAEVIDAMFQPTVKVTNKLDEDGNAKYPSLIRLKTPKTRDGEVMTDVFLNKDTKIPFMDLPKGSKCMVVMELYTVWTFMKLGCGLTYRAMQVRFKPPAQKLEYAFADEDEEEASGSLVSDDVGSIPDDL